MTPNKCERVRAWYILGTDQFWEGMSEKDINQGALLTSASVDDWLFGDDAKFEVWYLSALDEVWVYCDDKLGNSYRSRATDDYEQNRHVVNALLKEAGEPAARWPCPEAPEELRTLCRMFVELYGGRHD